MPNKRKYTNGSIDFIVPESIHTKLKVFAAYNKIPMSSVVRAVVAEWFEEHPAPEKPAAEPGMRMSIEFAPDHYASWDAKATADGIPVSALLRALIRQKLKEVESK